METTSPGFVRGMRVEFHAGDLGWLPLPTPEEFNSTWLDLLRLEFRDCDIRITWQGTEQHIANSGMRLSLEANMLVFDLVNGCSLNHRREGTPSIVVPMPDGPKPKTTGEVLDSVVVEVLNAGLIEDVRGSCTITALGHEYYLQHALTPRVETAKNQQTDTLPKKACRFRCSEELLKLATWSLSAMF